MPLQPFSQITVRFAQLATSGLLVIQATIATTVIGAFAPTNSGWLAASSASAQEAQPAVPMPGSVSTSAMDLKPVPNVSCLLAEEVGARPDHCKAYGGDLTRRGLNPESLKEAEQAINNGTDYSTQPSDEVVRIPLVQW